VFRYIKEGEELVEQPFRRLISEEQLLTHPHNGFWARTDNFKDRQELEDLYSRGDAPWAVWNGHH
jgi:glucose-1-phosphate cytidylyltransferase